MNRTDIHCPSQIIPANYSFVAMEYLKFDYSNPMASCDAIEGNRARLREHIKATGGSYASHQHGGNCMICGASAIYTACFYHQLTNAYIRVGQDCAEKLAMGHYDDFNLFKKIVGEYRTAVAGKRKAEQLLTDAGISACWTVYQTPWAESDMFEETTIKDIVGKLVKYGNVSDAQVNFLRKLLQKIADRPALQAKREAEKLSAADCPTGRLEITGTVLSRKEKESEFGWAWKMLVQHDSGYKVYGTCPAGVSVGDRITFKGTVKVADNDPKFGFFSRPILVTVHQHADTVIPTTLVQPRPRTRTPLLPWSV